MIFSWIITVSVFSVSVALVVPSTLTAGTNLLRDFSTTRQTASRANRSSKLSLPEVAEFAPVGVGRAQHTPLPADALQRVKSFFEARLGSRYMEQNCVATTYPGWEGLPLQMCTYSVKGHKDVARKTAKVILLDASPEQLARWVVSSCMVATGSAGVRCTRKLGRQIIGQSGAQFPVAGIVFEDILPEDGRFEVFAFRSGVTVRVHGVTHLGTAQPSDAEIENSLNGEVISALRFARIQSTTREQYKAAGGTRDVAGLAWLDVVRDLYKAAWDNDRNELMIAWARANAGSLK
jgi:endoglucanase